MGIPFLDLLRYSKRQRQAAKEMWAEIRTGVSFEVPASLSTDDDCMKAIELMCKQHPEVVMGQRSAGANGAPVTFQARGIIVGLRSSIRASLDAKEVLSQFGYMPDVNNVVEMLSAQERFIRQSGGLTPEQAVKEAQLASADRNRIVLETQAADRAKVDAKVAAVVGANEVDGKTVPVIGMKEVPGDVALRPGACTSCGGNDLTGHAKTCADPEIIADREALFGVTAEPQKAG